jgi:ABC-2 type transport system permease protein
MPIVDQGYQHWSGNLTGHAWRWLAVTRHGIRVGIKESKVRVMLLFAWIPALALAVALSVWGLIERKVETMAPFVRFLRSVGFGPEIMSDPRAFRVEFWTICCSTFMSLELTLAMFLIVLVGRQLISQDLRFNAMPLYFSRPMRRSDYFLGKLGVIGGYLAMVMIVPAVIAYVLGLAFSLDFSILRDTLPLLLSVILYGVLIAGSAGTLILAISSLSRNSRNVGLIWIGFWFGSNIVSDILNTIYTRQQVMQFGDVGVFAARLSTTNWRPCVSYTGNLARVGQKLLGTDACWRRIADLQPPHARPIVMGTLMGPQYPWVWSFGVLLVLFGLSAWILHGRVRSLDRLK